MSFKDFWQFVAPTRVVAGRRLLEGTGFELAKEGASRVLVVTDEAIRGTGLVDRVCDGVRDGRLEVAAIYDAPHPCGAHYDVPHGVANAINLPWAIEWNAAGGEDIADRYRDVNEVLGLEVGGSGEDVGGALAGHVRGLVSRLGLPGRLSEVGVPEAGIDQLAQDAEGDGCTLVNPRETTADDFRRIYAQAL